MDGANWRMGGRCGVRKPRQGGRGRTGGLADASDAADYGILDGADWRTQRTTESYTGRTAADGADWGGRGG